MRNGDTVNCDSTKDAFKMHQMWTMGTPMFLNKKCIGDIDNYCYNIPEKDILNLTIKTCKKHCRHQKISLENDVHRREPHSDLEQ